ncbi:MAG: RNA pseudouridine synthase [Rhodospirillaceae bacterium]|nr:RNA pseudouridine synthase [Rhodospirillaceae bacterium]|tara:strand:- start:2906 stop:3847 length:942 start_codon:yes stop_codon:yes gene_type:complete
MSEVKIIEVNPDELGIRIDRWFRRNFVGLTQGKIEKLIRTGQIRIDGKRVKSSTRLNAGQFIRVPPLLVGSEKIDKPVKSNQKFLDRDYIRSKVIYKDNDIIAINKPAGIAVQGGTKINRHIDAMLDELVYDSQFRPKLVHRLDKDTSGVLLLARNSFSAALLAKSFRKREVEKTYWAIVVGVPKCRKGVIDIALQKKSMVAKERMILGEGLSAITRFTVLESAGLSASWLALYPETGRTHQLRAHCRAIGTPIMGDKKYGRMDNITGSIPNVGKLHLHARELTTNHPRGGKITIEAAPPQFMSETIKYLGFK